MGFLASTVTSLLIRFLMISIIQICTEVYLISAGFFLGLISDMTISRSRFSFKFITYFRCRLRPIGLNVCPFLKYKIPCRKVFTRFAKSQFMSHLVYVKLLQSHFKSGEWNIKEQKIQHFIPLNCKARPDMPENSAYVSKIFIDDVTYGIW